MSLRIASLGFALATILTCHPALLAQQRTSTDSIVPTLDEPSTYAEQKPVVSLSASRPQLSEADLRGAFFTVTRIGPTDLTSLTVEYSVSGTAVAGQDYTALGRSVTIPRGASSANIAINPIQDSLKESDESIVLTLRSTTTSPYVLGDAGSATVTLVDYHSIVTISASDPNASEGLLRDPASFTISRAGSTNTSLAVNYSVSGTATSRSDYSALPGAATIPSGASAAQITISPVNDGVAESTESVVLTLQPGLSYAVGTPRQAQITITDEASTEVAVTAMTLQPSSVLGGQPARALVSLSDPAPPGGLTVGLSTTDTQGTVVIPNSVTVAAGEQAVQFWVTTRPVSQDTQVTITTGSGRAARSATLLVRPPPQLASLDISPTSVEVGHPVTATLRLTRPTDVGSGGLITRISLSAPGADGIVDFTLPSQVLVLEQQDTKTFTISTTAASELQSNMTVNVQAQVGTTQSIATQFTVRPPPPPEVISLVVSRAYVLGGNSLAGTVVLNKPASSRGFEVAIAPGTKGVNVPPDRTVRIAPGTDRKNFTITTSPVTAVTPVTITADPGGAAKTASFTVLPPPPELQSITLSRSSVPLGNTVTATIRLTKPVPEGTATLIAYVREGSCGGSCNSAVQLQISPSQLRFAPGSDTASAAIGTSLASGASMFTNSTRSIQVHHGANQTRSANLTVVAPPAPPDLESITLTPTSVGVGRLVTGSVKLAGPVPENSLVYHAQVTPDTCAPPGCNPAVTVQISNDGRLSFPPGTDRRTFQISTGLLSGATMSSDSTRTIRVRDARNQQRTTPLTVLAPPPPPALESLTLSPSSVVAGGSATATVRLTRTLPSDHRGFPIDVSIGTCDPASCDPNVRIATSALSSPVVILGGQDRATFQVHTRLMPDATLSANSLRTITVKHETQRESAQLTTLPPPPPPELTTITLTPSTVASGNSLSATVSINRPAPTGGFPVPLSSNRSSVTVPTGVTIPAGQLDQSFTITTSPVATTTTTLITAGRGESARSASFTLLASINLTGLEIIPGDNVISGTNLSGRVTLSVNAPPGGFIVPLNSSDSSVAALPANVTVAAGQNQASFPISSTPVAQPVTVRITAGIGGDARHADLTITPLAVGALRLEPSPVIGGSNLQANLRLPTNGPLSVALLSSHPAIVPVPQVIAVPPNRQDITFNLATSAVAQPTEITITAGLGAGAKQQEILVLPAAGLEALHISPSNELVGGSMATGRIMLDGDAPPGGFAVPLQSGDTNFVSVPPGVTVPPGQHEASFSIATAPVATVETATITAGVGAGAKTETVILAPYPVSRFRLEPTTVIGGTSFGVDLRVDTEASVIVPLFSSDPATVALPPTITVPPHRQSVRFPVSTTTVFADTTVSITAGLGEGAKSRNLTVTPAAKLGALGTMPEGEVIGGSTAMGQLQLTADAPPGGFTVPLQTSDGSVATVPSTVVVAPGERDASFSIPTAPVGQPETVSITAGVGQFTRSVELTVLPFTLGRLRFEPRKAIGGRTVRCTVGLTSEAPPGGLVVALSSSNPAVAAVPQSVTVPVGRRDVTINLQTFAVSERTTVTITAGLGSGSLSEELEVR